MRSAADMNETNFKLGDKSTAALVFGSQMSKIVFSYVCYQR